MDVVVVGGGDGQVLIHALFTPVLTSLLASWFHALRNLAAADVCPGPLALTPLLRHFSFLLLFLLPSLPPPAPDVFAVRRSAWQAKLLQAQVDEVHVVGLPCQLQGQGALEPLVGLPVPHLLPGVVPRPPDFAHRGQVILVLVLGRGFTLVAFVRRVLGAFVLVVAAGCCGWLRLWLRPWLRLAVLVQQLHVLQSVGEGRLRGGRVRFVDGHHPS